MPYGFQNITFSVNILQKIIINTGHNITKPKHYTFRNTVKKEKKSVTVCIFSNL